MGDILLATINKDEFHPTLNEVGLRSFSFSRRHNLWIHSALHHEISQNVFMFDELGVKTHWK